MIDHAGESLCLQWHVFPGYNPCSLRQLGCYFVSGATDGLKMTQERVFFARPVLKCQNHLYQYCPLSSQGRISREIYQGNACKGRGRDSGHRPWEPPACNSGSDTCGRRAGRKEGWVGKVSAGGTVLRQFVLAEAEAHSQSSPSEESLGPAPWASVGAPAMRPGGTRSQQDQGSRSRGVAMGNVSQLCFQVLCLPDPRKC